MLLIRCYSFQLFVLALFLGLSPITAAIAENVWTTPPSVFSQEEILSSFYQDLQGGFYGGPFKGFEYSKKNVSIFIRYLDRLPQELSSAEKNLFSRRIIHYLGKKRELFEFIIGQPAHSFPPKDTKSDTSPWPPTPEYPKDTPFKIMKIEELVRLIKERKFFFFTGAGISAGAGIHTMNSLWNELGYQEGTPVDPFVTHALNKPELLISMILKFYASARDSAPTLAHQVITKIALKRGAQIVTSNFDRLHHRTGVLPYRTMGHDVDADLGKDGGLSQIESIITIGLGRDSRHILGAFKQKHPQAPIIAIDLHAPSYLGPHDYWVEGDCQKIFAEIDHSF